MILCAEAESVIFDEITYATCAKLTGNSISVQGDRVVLVKRAHPPIQGQWSIPGGVLEVGEMLREAAIREAREETGLVVETLDLLGVFDRVVHDETGKTLYHY